MGLFTSMLKLFAIIIMILCLFLALGSDAWASKPIKIEKWMSTAWLVKNKYIRCSKVWYPKNHIPYKTGCFLKYYKPCYKGWCRK